MGLDQRQRLPRPNGGASKDILLFLFYLDLMIELTLTAGVRGGHRHTVRGLLRLPPRRGGRLQLHQEKDGNQRGRGNQQGKGETQDP